MHHYVRSLIPIGHEIVGVNIQKYAPRHIVSPTWPKVILETGIHVETANNADHTFPFLPTLTLLIL
jgi:hypothetical protein